MLSTLQDVIEYTKNANTVWLAISTKSNAYKLEPELLWPGRVQSVRIFKPGLDKRIEVWKIDLDNLTALYNPPFPTAPPDGTG
jgi:hypothetical protein